MDARKEGEEETTVKKTGTSEEAKKQKRQRRGPEGREKIGQPVGEGKKQQEQSDQNKKQPKR